MVFSMGIKLVRGAYLMHETNKAIQENRSSPIQISKKATDEAYDKMVSQILHQIAEHNHSNSNSNSNSTNNVAIAICTHNRQSITTATQLMADLGIKNNHKYVHFAQLKGMCDNLTFGLSMQGYNALKWIPYGHFNDIWPYLMRRLYENQDMLGATSKERYDYFKEFCRRLYQS